MRQVVPGTIGESVVNYRDGKILSNRRSHHVKDAQGIEGIFGLTRTSPNGTAGQI